MKRDMNLIRKILLKYDRSTSMRFFSREVKVAFLKIVSESIFVIEGYSREQIGFHIYLMGQAGLFKVVDITRLDDPSPQARPLCFDNRGILFLYIARNEANWEKANEIIENNNLPMTFDILEDILINLFNRRNHPDFDELGYILTNLYTPKFLSRIGKYEVDEIHPR